MTHNITVGIGLFIETFFMPSKKTTTISEFWSSMPNQKNTDVFFSFLQMSCKENMTFGRRKEKNQLSGSKRVE